jgi:light-harvesting complex 1 alpha chain
MWRVWQTFNPQRILPALAVFLFTLAVLIHFILLSTDRYNWLDGANPAPAATAAVATVAEAA